MSVEIEKKFILSAGQSESVIENLKQFGAKYVGEDLEENILYASRVLETKNAILRIRKIKGKTVLTYKQQIENDSNIKHQTEFETVVEKADELEHIVEALGLEKILIYEKRRQIWSFRQVEIVLDELPFGQYMEIEGSITAIAEAEMLLELENFQVELETYPQLTRRFGVQKEKLIEARF